MKHVCGGDCCWCWCWRRWFDDADDDVDDGRDPDDGANDERLWQIESRDGNDVDSIDHQTWTQRLPSTMANPRSWDMHRCGVDDVHRNGDAIDEFADDDADAD